MFKWLVSKFRKESGDTVIDTGRIFDDSQKEISLSDYLRGVEDRIKNCERVTMRCEKRMSRAGLASIDVDSDHKEPAAATTEPKPAPQEGDDLSNFPEFMKQISREEF